MTSVAHTLRGIVRWSIIALTIVPLAPLLLQVDLNGAANPGGTLGWYFPYITTGAITFRAIVETAFFAWLALAIIRPEFRPDFRKPIVAIATALTVVSTLAAFLGVDPIRSVWSNFERMEGLVGWLHLYALFLVVVSTMREREDWKGFVYGLWGASVLNGLLALSVDDGKRFDTTVDGRAAGIIGNPIYLAIHMFMSAGFIAWWVASARSVGQKVSSVTVWLASASIALFLFAIALSGTRGTFVAVAFALLSGGAFVVWKATDAPKLRRFAFVTIAVVAVLSASLYMVRNQQWVKDAPLLERASSVFNFQGGTVAARWNNWQIALDAVAARPVLGWGQDNYIYPFTYFFNPKMANEEPWFDRTHNQFMDWFVHTGVVGGVLYLALVAFVFISITRMRDASVLERAVLVGVVVGYCTHNLFVFDYLVSAMLFMMLAAYAAARSPRFGSGEIASIGANGRDAGESRGVSVEAEPAIVAGAAVCFAVAFWVVVIPAASGASAIITGLSSQFLDERRAAFEYVISERKTGYTEAIEQYVVSAMQVAGANELPQEDRLAYMRAAAAPLEAELDRSPNNVRTLMFRGALLSRFGDADGAVATFERMAELAPNRPNNLEMLFDAYIARGAEGDAERANELSAHMFALAPDSLDARLAYAKSLILSGDVAGADTVLEGIDLYAAGKSAVLFEAYQRIGRFDRVAEILERYLVDRPGNVEITYSLAATYFQAGDKTKAIAVLSALAASSTDAELKADVQRLISAIRAGKNPIQ